MINTIGELFGYLLMILFIITLMFISFGVPFAIAFRLCRWIIGI